MLGKIRTSGEFDNPRLLVLLSYSHDRRSHDPSSKLGIRPSQAIFTAEVCGATKLNCYHRLISQPTDGKYCFVFNHTDSNRLRDLKAWKFFATPLGTLRALREILSFQRLTISHFVAL